MSPKRPLPRGAGRPRTTSPELIQEAAFESFQLRGYAASGIDQIARAAGVSRSTFFNYFPAKSDVFWLDLDPALDALISAIGRLHAEARDAAEAGLRRAPDPLVTLDAALIDAARAFGPTRVPWMLTQSALLGDTDELVASALPRAQRLIAAIERHLTRARFGIPLLVHTTSLATVGALLASAQAWAAAGTGRGHLAPYLATALSTVRH